MPLNNCVFGKLLRIENGEVWFCQQLPQGFAKVWRIKEIIEGEIIEDKLQEVVS